MDLAGVIPGEALIARGTGHEAPALVSEMVYDARLFTGTRFFRFSTRLLGEGSGPLGCHYLSYPEVVAQAIVRRHHRVQTAITGKIRTNEYLRLPVAVNVENLSAFGAGISAGEDILAVGQSARLAMNLPTGTSDGANRAIAVVVKVRNCRQEGIRFRYGLEFEQASDEVRREIKDYVLACVAAA
ncbi:PilZ domain-containing protein [Paraburkholderia lycopersici]|uniref:PilZ domain-containing protein n=1 Tax=Paraburkholderia lycopersici TaxID=416944 RepID=A0A1G6YJ12_9BURK|nr:PilZ domain-containing protein [Paraburkholderia lycopersici]SDD90368.1 PilZ domain-containing protein [Paraburkholderia lycopersici]